MSDRIAEAAKLAPSASLTVEEVRSVRHWNEHLFSFTITRPPSFRFRSGEFVMIGLPGEGRPLLRAYSIASPAYADELEFLSIKVPDGPLTSRLQKIQPGDPVYLGRKPTGTLVADALLPGKRLFMLSTGTGLAPFLSLARDPDIYDRFNQIVIVHCVRQVSDLAFREELESQLAGDPLVQDQALLQFHYLPTVTREPFRTTGRIDALIADGSLFGHPLTGPAAFDPATDRVMMCGSMAMIRDLQARFEELGFQEGSNAAPGDFVIERAFVG
ncbi:Ferredoxin--NADP reductase [uncultured Sphingopyxis sp.]|uniref:ferredoxin--NADP(+) reductase n=1 Tax=uncultured Sphingopyxis sp. TaxID=310581 RepID=A0A1Y5PVZ5_9SPHN|nr:ferredoxin--NADP reductase [uncultured Sphingopyxis sp.]SBV31394.1 Ferredoxin--NADP reductase [uncultured Sphingopyxis sp.]